MSTLTHTQDITTAFAKIQSLAGIGVDTDPATVSKWVAAEFTKGEVAFARMLQGGRRPQLARKSEPFAAGFAYAESVDNGADVLEDAVTYVAAQMAQWHDRLVRHTDAMAAADALFEDSNAATMEPSLAHYESAELQEAMGVLHGFGTFAKDGRFSPNIIRSFAEDALLTNVRNNLPRESGWGMEQIVDRLHRMVKANQLVKGGRVALQFTNNTDTDAYGNSFQYEAGAPEIVFLVMPEGSQAYQRGEVVWALYYLPAVREWIHPKTGEIRTSSSWYNDKGWAGVVKAYRTYAAAQEDVAELTQAVRSIRDADADEAAAELGTTVEDRSEKRAKKDHTFSPI